MADPNETSLLAAVQDHCAKIAGAKPIAESDHDDLAAFAEMVEGLRNAITALDDFEGRRSPLSLALERVLENVVAPAPVSAAVLPALELPETPTVDDLLVLLKEREAVYGERLSAVAAAVRANDARRQALMAALGELAKRPR